ncbi:hypothetical protein BGX26_005677, partial [Mortierella sp. AD094]
MFEYYSLLQRRQEEVFVGHTHSTIQADSSQSVPQDYSKAIGLYQMAEDQGDDYAQRNLGFIYHEGHGAPQDYSKAIELCQKAANQGHATAQNNPGFMYQKGQGVPQDYSKAIKLYQKAANQGHTTAQNNPGSMYTANKEIGGSEHFTTTLGKATWSEIKDRIPVLCHDIILSQRAIFDQDINLPIVKYALPEEGERITSTPQLAYCLSLLRPSLVSNDGRDEIEYSWSQAKVNDPDEQGRLQAVAADIVKAFVRDELKNPDAVAEVVCLVAVLEHGDFRDLLQAFLVGIEQSMFLDINLLDGLAQLMRNSIRGYLVADDLVRILELLNKRIKDNHRLSTRHIYRLTSTISRVLDSMVDSQVEGLNREHLRMPLSEYLKELYDSSDPYLAYQAAYMHQALQYVIDGRTILQVMIRRTENSFRGILGVTCAVEVLDLNAFIQGLQSIQVGSTRAAQGFQELFGKVFIFTCKSAWYPALRGLDILLQEGRLTEFEKLVREAPCRHDLAFQWGVCQRLGELAGNSVLDAKTRKCAVNFLGELYKDHVARGQQVNIRQWILRILNQLADSSMSIIAGQAQILLQELEMDDSAEKQMLYQPRLEANTGPYPMKVPLPPQESPLLDCVQKKVDVK